MFCFFFQAEDGIRDWSVTGVQTCALPILYIDPTDRPLSAGEIFALFLLGVTFVGCLALVVVIGYTKGEININLTRADVVTQAQTSLYHWLDLLKAALPFSL